MLHLAEVNSAHSKPDLDRLREIGWFLWDPIGLDGGTGIWKEEPFANEYDEYLAEALRMLRTGKGHDAVVRYLFHIEAELMGLGPKEINSEIEQRLSLVVQAIADDSSIWIKDQN